jgi:aspartyl-tRNA(Asn)/glutamyl-tRNA(Gln) amidotransferase subunit A
LDLTELGLKDAAELIRKGDLTSYELTSTYLTRIKQLNEKMNVFITITDGDALRAARIADDEFKAGHYRSKLHGIPIALKDVFETSGIRTTAGSKLLGAYIPTNNAYVVQQLAEAGAIVLGKLNLHEWALGVTNVNPHFGAVINPWNAGHVPGGSSGGSAAAVASRLCLGSLGTDTGGSIRIPSSFCGTVGLKPTYGYVSLRGVIPLSWSLDHVGPITRTVEDAAILFEGINGYDSLDPVSTLRTQYVRSETLQPTVEKLRFLFLSNMFEQVDEEVAKAVYAARSRFEELGAQVSEGNYYDVEDDLKWQGIVLLSDAAAYHKAHLSDSATEIGFDVLARLKMGEAMSGIDVAMAHRNLVVARRNRASMFDQADMLIIPTTQSPAPPRADLDPVAAARKFTKLTAPFNFAGLPAISVPCGFTASGLPIGMQLVAGPWKESTLLEAALAYQSVTDWHKRKPPL